MKCEDQEETEVDLLSDPQSNRRHLEGPTWRAILSSEHLITSQSDRSAARAMEEENGISEGRLKEPNR